MLLILLENAIFALMSTKPRKQSDVSPCKSFTDAGVRVLLPYLPWDQGTRNSGQSDVVSMVDYIISSDSDGKRDIALTDLWQAVNSMTSKMAKISHKKGQKRAKQRAQKGPQNKPK